MSFLKEKSAYRPVPVEVAFAWIVTVASGLAVAAYLFRSWFGA